MAAAIVSLLTMFLAALPAILHMIQVQRDKEQHDTKALVDRDIDELARQLSEPEPIPPHAQTGV